MIVATLAIPQQLGLVGFVMEMRWIGMNNTLFPLIVSGMANAFGVFWMRQFIEVQCRMRSSRAAGWTDAGNSASFSG